MKTLISFYREGNIISSLVEDNLDLIIGVMIDSFLNHDKAPETMFGKDIAIEDGYLSVKEPNTKVKEVKSLVEWEELASHYESAYIMDEYELYHYDNNDYVWVDDDKYTNCICPECGRVVSYSLINGRYCEECFIECGLKDIFKEAMEENDELFTEYEKLSVVGNTIDEFYKRTYRFPRKVREAAKNMAKEYLAKTAKEMEISTLLGGFANV